MGEALLAAGPDPPAWLGPTAALVVAAAVIGYLSVRLRVVSIVGFLLAGVLIGPHQLGLVQRQEVVEAAADVGVILLLFTIGIEFSLARLARIRRWILLGGGLQVGLTAALTVAVLSAAGTGWREGVFTGFLVALSSTAIVLTLLGDAGEMGTARGQLALAMLIFQDLAVIGMVLLVPLLGPESPGGDDPGRDLAVALGKAVAIVLAVLVLARRVMPPLLERVARTCSPEVFLLSVVATCLGTAYLTAEAGVSVSLGAFLAGLVVSESRQSAHAFGEIMPLQIIFSATFFVSVGMLLDLRFVLANVPLVLAVVALVVTVKVAAGALGAAALRVGAGTAVGTALLLAQVGEFSFVLERVGRDAGLSPFGVGAEGSQAFIAATVLLMVGTPVLGASGRRLARRLGGPRDRSHPSAGGAAGVPEAADGHVVMSGWGPAVRELGATLQARGVPVVVTTLSPDLAAQAERDGHRVVRGDPTKLSVLRAAGVERARVVVIAEDEPEHAARIAAVVGGMSPARLVVRPLGPVDPGELAAAGVHAVVDRDRASAQELTRVVAAALDGGPDGIGSVGGRTVDPTALVRYPMPPEPPCPHAGAVRPVLPSAAGCEECLRAGEGWVHLRLCLSCGHVGCCDSSPRRHARAHFERTEHPYIASAEPGEGWAFCFYDQTRVEPAG